jgi:hypothetical protein
MQVAPCPHPQDSADIKVTSRQNCFNSPFTLQIKKILLFFRMQLLCSKLDMLFKVNIPLDEAYSMLSPYIK